MELSKFKIAGFVVMAGCLLATCETPENEFKGTVPVEIEDVTIPEFGQVNQEIEILAYAEAANGCFKNLTITLRQTASHYYLLRGTSHFESANTCPAVVVSLDTTIIFKPTAAGTFYFQTNEDPFNIRLDTLVIN